MKLKPIKNKKLLFCKKIAKFIPEAKVTLLTGLPGTGKTISILKHLNKYGIKPIIFNLDEDAEVLKYKLTGSISSAKTFINFINGKYTDLDNEVVIIDTYQRVEEILKITKTKHELKFTSRLLHLAKKHSITIIIIGHPADYVGRSSIFNDNPSLIRNCYEHLHLDKIEDKRRKPPTLNYRLYVNKARGTGAFIIENWMRDEK